MTSEGQTTRTLAIETDTRLAALYNARNEAASYRSSDAKTLAFYEEKRNNSFDAERRIPELKAAIAARDAEIAAIVAEMLPLEAIFNKHRWTRAFLVITSGKGHVHRSMECSTCYPTTTFVWLPNYSGETETQIVADAGERACTVCYPSAPVEVLARPSRIFSDDERAAQVRKDERAAAKVARDAKRAAAAPTKNGTYLVIPDAYTAADGKVRIYNRTITTERTAVTEYVHMARMITWSKDAAQIDSMRIAGAKIEIALAEKHGVTLDAERAALAKKIAAKIKKEGA